MPGFSAKLEKVRKNAIAFMDENAPLEGWQYKAHRFIHFWVMIIRSFTQNRLPVRASALAYATLLALIPMLAVVMSVSSTFLKQKGQASIEHFINNLVASVTPPDLLRTNTVSAATNLVVTVTNVSRSSPGPAAMPIEDPLETAGKTNVLEISRVAGTTNQIVEPAFLDNPEAARARETVASKINEFIQNTQSGALGMGGSVVLIFVAISMLSRIEDTFNDIWGVVRGRTWAVRTVLYWGVITLAPLLFIVAIALSTGPHLDRTRNLITYYPFLASLLFRLLPVVVLSITFCLFYMLMPNTRVSWRAALVGGSIAGLLFHLNNVFSVLYVSRVVSYSKVYGSLGLVPVFMVGLYLSWLILLFGAQVAYGYQNRATYLEEKQCEQINQRGREFVALRLMTAICQRFNTGEPPPSVNQMARHLAVPSRLARQVLQTLVLARLVVETYGTETGYIPARPLHTINCHDVLMAMRAANGSELATREEPTRVEVYGEFARIQEAERQAASAVDMLALVNRTESCRAIGSGTLVNERG